MKKTSTEVEVFIHGGMCSSYSGRCMLSNHMTNRDATRGGCAHSCRWNYDLYMGNELISDNDRFQFSSKDLTLPCDYLSILQRNKIELNLLVDFLLTIQNFLSDKEFYNLLIIKDSLFLME